MNNNLDEYTAEYLINAHEVDINGRARLTTLLNCLQNTAWLHYNTAVKSFGELIGNDMFWVITRAHLKIHRMPAWEELLKIKTWAPFARKITTYRNFIVSSEDREIAEAVFEWMVLDRKRSRPVKLEQFAGKWPFKNTGLLLDMDFNIEPINGEIKRGLKAFYSDIDVNRHVNNVKYIEWLIDSFEKDILNNYVPAEISIQFLAQAKEGDNIQCSLDDAGPDNIRGSVSNSGTGKELCRMLSSWHKNTTQTV